MTPLAHAIVKDSTLPLAARKHDAIGKQLRLLDGVHFFECSSVVEVAAQLGHDFLRRPDTLGILAFLPAPRCWIEWKSPSAPYRMAVLIEETGDPMIAVACALTEKSTSVEELAQTAFELPLNRSDRIGTWSPGEAMPSTIWSTIGKLAPVLYGLLAMINTPRVILSRQHMPHAGLQRQLIASRAITGKYPVGAWSELLLRVRPPNIPEGEREAHLTGAKALHFCRQHLRIRLGRLELVTAHWRGYAALGIKHTRYRLGF